MFGGHRICADWGVIMLVDGINSGSIFWILLIIVLFRGNFKTIRFRIITKKISCISLISVSKIGCFFLLWSLIPYTLPSDGDCVRLGNLRMTKVSIFPLGIQLFLYGNSGRLKSRYVLSVCFRRMTSKKTYGNRKFYALPDEYPLRGTKVRATQSAKKNEDAAKLIKYIDDNVIGKNTTFSGPYGRRKGKQTSVCKFCRPVLSLSCKFSSWCVQFVKHSTMWRLGLPVSLHMFG